MAAAVLIGTQLSLAETRRQGVDEDVFLNLILLGAPLSWIGARLYYVIFNWSYYRNHLIQIPQIWEGGLAIHGGIFTAIVVGLWYCRRHKLVFWQIADLVAPSFILGQSIGRWGNFFNQEAYGYPTTLPWAMFIAGEWRHPTFLYESIWNFIVFLFLLRLKNNPRIKQGDVFISYLGLYSVGRFIVEGFRTDSLMLGPFRAAQIASAAIVGITIILLFYRHKSKV